MKHLTRLLYLLLFTAVLTIAAAPVTHGEESSKTKIEKFDSAGFRSPASIHAPGYFWFLNGPLQEAEVRSRVRDMAAAGAETICPHPFPKEFRKIFMSTMTPAYLSPEYFKVYAAIVDECAKLNLSCWLYDEGGWPSGGACGQVYASNPERYRRTRVVPDEKGNPKFVKEDVNPDMKSTTPDILVPGVTEKFLELTHERYYKTVGKHFGKTIRFAFMDEPEMSRTSRFYLGWTADFSEQFLKRKGYKIEPYLMAILSESFEPDVIQARIDFYDVSSRLFEERFMLPIRTWCRAHNILSSGHMGGEDEIDTMFSHGHGHTMRVLRLMDAPGVDVIWRQLWPGERMHSFPKFASSVASQGGHRFVIAEMSGVYGNGLTMDQMRALLDYMVLCGVNTFVNCAIPHSTEGGLMMGERPHFGPINPQWRQIRPFHDYCSRVSKLGASGKPTAETALFFDAWSSWGHHCFARYADDLREEIARHLMENQCDFDYVDDDALRDAKMVDGKLTVGEAAYSQLIIPAGARMAPEASAALEKFKKEGLRVISQDDIGAIAPTLEISRRDWRLRVRRHQLANGDALYFIYNNSGRTVRAEMRAREREAVAWCNAEDGEIYRVGQRGIWNYEFPPFRLAVFLAGPGAKAAKAMPAVPGKVLAVLNGPWQLRPVIKTIAGAKDYEIIDCAKEKAQKIELGDWKAYLGGAFSGEAVYSAEFEAVPGAAWLDLGDVRYSASVKVNGKPVGIRPYPPYVYNISQAVKPGKNTVEIAVANTLANAISPQSVLDHWKKTLPFICPYEYRQRNFERESLPSGLYGPVVLKESVLPPGNQQENFQ